MLLQTNSYVVSEEKRPEHVRLMRRFAQIMARLGLEQFEVLEQIGPGFGTGRPSGRFVQIMRFRDKQHQQQVQALERSDPEAQELIGRFCELVEFAEQQQQGLATAHYYLAVVESGAPAAPRRERRVPPKLPGVAPLGSDGFALLRWSPSRVCLDAIDIEISDERWQQHMQRYVRAPSRSASAP